MPAKLILTKKKSIRERAPRARVPGMVILVVAIGTLPALAQTSRASLRGSVADASGAAVADVLLRAIHEPTNEVRTTRTGREGAFALTLLEPGAYRLEVEHPRHKKYVQRLGLQVGEEARVAVALELGTLSETVFVVAPVPPLKRESPALGTLIENRQVTELPLDGRNFLELSLLVPGSSPPAQGSPGSARGDFAFNVNGAREDANAFLLDGAENLDPKLNTVGVRPPVDAIQEFEVLTSGYGAEFGRHAGAQVNVVLKSGSNAVTGTGYEFFRNGALDARNFFAPRNEPAPDYQRNQFGFSIGGPLARNRTFFFGDYEGTRSREGITRVTNVPTLAERRGDFSQSVFPVPRNPFTGQPFPNGRLPDFLIHPIGGAIAALYPEPNRSVPFQNHVSSPVQRDRQDQFDTRIDHRLADRSQLVGRYSFADRDLFEPFSGPSFAVVPGFGNNVPRRAQNLVGTETHIFSSSLVNEARVVFSRVSAGVFHENQGQSLNRSVGLPELSSNPRDHGLSFITVTGFSPLGHESNNPQRSTTSIFQVADTATWTRGDHLVKFGFDFRAVRQDAFRDVQSRGFLRFSDRGYTGNALADLLLGLPVLTGGARLDNPQRLRTENVGLFVQDSYHLARNFTLTAGLRYELTSPPVDAGDRANIYNPVSHSLVRVGTGGIPRSGYETDKNNLAPRAGLSWSPTVSGNTVVRASYGLYYTQSALAAGEGLYFSAPYFDLNLYFPLPPALLTLSDPFPATFPFALPRSALTFQRDLRTPFMHHYMASVQQQLGTTRMVEVAYVGSRGEKLYGFRDINQAAPSADPFNPRPVPEFADINILESRARSRYNSFQARLQQRTSRGLSLLAAYTLSKSMDDASGVFTSAGDPNLPQDSRHPEAEYGRSNFDVRQRVSLGFSYDLPANIGGPGFAPRLLSGWQISGVATFQSGRPFTVALVPEFDNSNTGQSAGLGFGANDRPNLTGDPALSNPAADRWFDTNAFAFPPYGSFGNAGRNILEGPGYANINLAVHKQVALTDDVRLQLRVEAFNLFNRVNFELPDAFVGSPTFGQILSAGSPRHIQFGVKLIF